MTTFSDYKPKNGLRQPRIIYKVDDPAMAPLEELRRLGGMRNMNEIYLEALVIGAHVVLGRLRNEKGSSVEVVTQDMALVASMSPPVSTLPAHQSLGENEVVQSPEHATGEPCPVLRVPPMPEPRIVRAGPPSSSAAMAQFKRFGDL